MKTKIIFTLSILMLVVFSLTCVQAVDYQAVPNSANGTGDYNTVFVGVRNMESSSGVLGLSATIDANGTETSNSNNIDSHMIKATEFGTIITLTNSQYGPGYGNVSASTSDHILNTTASSTTLNATGVYDMRCHHYSSNYYAGTHSNWGIGLSMFVGESLFGNAKSRYYDLYATASDRKAGDGVEFGITLSGGSGFRFYSRNTSYVIHDGYDDGMSTSYAVVVNGQGI